MGGAGHGSTFSTRATKGRRDESDTPSPAIWLAYLVPNLNRRLLASRRTVDAMTMQHNPNAPHYYYPDCG